MCEPVSLMTAASLAATAVGTGMQIRGQQQARSAQNDAVAAERIRQQGIQERQAGVTAQATEQAAPERVQQATTDATAVRDAALRAATPAQTGYMPGQSSGPQIVRDEVDRQRQVAANFTNQQGGARAALGGWADSLFGLRQGIGRAQQNLQTQAGFARGSGSVLPLEMDKAGMAGQGMRTAGDLFVTAPRLASGLSGMFSTGGVPGGPKGDPLPPGIH